jgi:hypothetical protein
MNAMNPGSTGLLEGNLTYYLKAANGTIVDSVGVPSTSPMLQAVVPFDDFKAVALALANLSAQPSTITLTLFDNKNAQVGVATHTLGNNQQVPRFLSQFFPSVSLTSGRVEIQSNVPFVGTALTFIEGGQASSIPFLSPVRLYDVTVNFSGGTETAQVFLSINSGYVTGYIVDTQHYDPQQPFGQQADRLTGLFVGGNLELFLHESRGQSNETVAYLQIPGFNPLQRTQSGTVLVYLVNPPGVAVRANLTMTAAN